MEENRMKWIKVEDQRPEPFTLIWLYWRDREVAYGYYMYNDSEFIPDEPSEGYYSLEHEKSRWVTHWMPIERPEPPEKD